MTMQLGIDFHLSIFDSFTSLLHNEDEKLETFWASI